MSLSDNLDSVAPARGFSAAADRLLPYSLERALLWLMAGTLALFLAAVLATGAAVDWAGLGQVLGIGTALIVFGLWTRVARGFDRLSLCLIAVGFYNNFGNLTALLIFMGFPLSAPVIDPALAQIDAAVGYHWLPLVEAMAAQPALSTGLALVYNSALLQLAAVIGILAWRGDARALHLFMLAGALTLAVTIVIWMLWPSLGPATMHPIPAETEAAANLVVGSAYAAELLRLAAEGPAILSPDSVLGTIAFPSYHMIMACLAVWYSRGTVLFLPAVGLNLPMIPATMIHGGHHATDLLGGLAVFALVILVLRHALPPARRGA